MKIVVIDDNPDFLEMMRSLLRIEGYEVIVCQAGDEAHQLIEAVAPDAVILDLVIPGFDGWRVLDHLAGEDGRTKVPVVVCSGEYAEVVTLERQLARYGCEILLKPFDFRDLIDVIERVTGQPATAGSHSVGA